MQNQLKYYFSRIQNAQKNLQGQSLGCLKLHRKLMK